MSEPRRSQTQFVIIGTIALAVACILQAAATPDREEEVQRFVRLSEEAQPAVAALTGLPPGEPVKVNMMTRKEMGEFLRTTVRIEYPNDDLYKFSLCLAEIGLVPPGYDLTKGLVDLIAEQAGAVYDPHAKTLNGLVDLPRSMKSLPVQKYIIAHELCHALQDREIDIVAQSEVALKNNDYSYALRSVIEGMASLVMLAYSQNLSLEQVPDVRTIMRANFSRNERNPGMKALASSPRYLRESLIGPYAEGGAFAQAWLEANSGLSLGAMLVKMPVSSEQVLHFEKYVEGDLPTPIDLSAAAALMPSEWKLFYANTLGEFDLRVLFEIYQVTEAHATDIASGWDGLKFEAYTDPDSEMVLLGSSVWDTEEDAVEFDNGFAMVLAAIRDSSEFRLVQHGTRVNFVVCRIDENTREGILGVLGEAEGNRE